MKQLCAVVFTIVSSVAADSAFYPGFNTGIRNRFDGFNAQTQVIGGQRVNLQGGIPLNVQGINQIGYLPALQTKNIFNNQLSGLQGNAQRPGGLLNNQGLQNLGARFNLGTLPFQQNIPINPAYNSQANLGQVAQSSLDRLNQARQLGNFIGSGVAAGVGTIPNNLIGLKANFGSIPINAAIRQQQLAPTQIISRGQNLQGLNGIAGNALLQTQLTGDSNRNNQLNKSPFNQILVNPSTPFNNIRNQNAQQIIANLNKNYLTQMSNGFKGSANTLMGNIGQLQTNVASQLSNPTALSNIFNQYTRVSQNSIDNAFSRMFATVNKDVADFINRLNTEVGNIAQIINNSFLKAINQLNNTLLSNSTASLGNYLNHTTPNLMKISSINSFSNFIEEFNKGFTNAFNAWINQKGNIGKLPFDNWYSRLATAQLSPILNSLEKLSTGIVNNHPQSMSSTANGSLPHPISNNYSVSKPNSTLDNIINTTANSTNLENLPEISAILSDDGKQLRDYLVNINSTQDILSKWDGVVKDKAKGTRLNVTSYEKRSPFCICDGDLSCNCCLTLDLEVIKKEVCLEAVAPKPGNGSQISIIMDNKRQNITETNGENKQVKFDLEDLANGNLEISSKLSANNTTQQEFCLSAILDLLGVSFSSIPLGCYLLLNQTISISD